MRAARPALVALIGVAAVLLAASPALAATGVKLILSAGHGAAGSSVTATFSYPTSWGWFGPSCDGPVTFRWDGRAVAQAGPGRSGGSCSASVTITPPSSASGAHVVNASAPHSGSAEATYSIDPAPVPPRPTPSPAPPPPVADEPAPVQAVSAPQGPQPSQAGRSAQPSQSARPSHSARPTPSAGSSSPSAVSAPDLYGNVVPTDPAALAAMDAPMVVVRPVASTPLGVWVLMAGGTLILLGVALVVTVRLFRRRHRVAFSL